MKPKMSFFILMLLSIEPFSHLINGLFQAEVFLSLACKCFPQWANHGVQRWVFHGDFCKKKVNLLCCCYTAKPVEVRGVYSNMYVFHRGERQQ